MSRSGIILLLLAAGVADAHKGFLANTNGLQPELVAHTLVQVEDEWRSQAQAFNECTQSLSEGEDMNECVSAAKAFQKSCGTIVHAVVESSSGDKSRVVEYMNEVCGEKELQNWRKENCQSFAALITDAMSADSYQNREQLDGSALCSSFWTSLSQQEKVWADQEKAEREAEEKRLAEQRAEEEKRAAEQRAADEKRLAEEQKAEEEKRAAEQAAEEQKQKEMEEAQKKEQEEAAKKAQPAANSSPSTPKETKSASFLSVEHRLQPELVAHTLLQVEDEWRSQAQAFSECSAGLAEGEDINECMSATKAFHKSCNTIVSAVVKSSSGDRERVVEYMNEVCGEKELQGWRQENCQSLASLITDSMTADSYENREQLDGSALCGSFWTTVSKQEKAWEEQERAEKEAEEKRLAEQRAEEEKRAAEERAAEEKRLAEKKAEEEKRAAEEAAEEQKRREIEEAQKQEAEEAAIKAAQKTTSPAPQAVEQKASTTPPAKK